MAVCYRLGVDIGSTTVKVVVIDEKNLVLFSEYKRHFANIQETLAGLLADAYEKLGDLTLYPVITGTPVSGEYVSNYLRWMDSWVLIIQN